MKDYLNYDEFASLYDTTRVIPSASLDEIATLCVRAARRRGASGYFLDAGVGTGRFAIPVSRVFDGTVVGVDVSIEMLRRARLKAMGQASLIRSDLLRLPFRACMFDGILAVHILHLIRDWRGVLDELQRALAPGGVLLIGSEQGGRSILVDFYLQQARANGVAVSNLGADGISGALSYLRRRRSKGAIPRVELLSGQNLGWTRECRVSETLETLDRRPFSQMRNVGAMHGKLIEATREYALRSFESLDWVESLEARFLLYGIWPDGGGTRR